MYVCIYIYMGEKNPTTFPISICRLLQRLEVEENENCVLTVKDIFDTYKIENALESVEMVVRNYETFSHILGKVYHGHEFRKSIFGNKLSCYPLKWKQLDPEEHLHQYDPSTILELFRSPESLR